MKKRKKILKRSFALILSMTMFFSFSLISFASSEDNPDIVFQKDYGFTTLDISETSLTAGWIDDVDVGNRYENFEEDFVECYSDISRLVGGYDTSLSSYYCLCYDLEYRNFILVCFNFPQSFDDGEYTRLYYDDVTDEFYVTLYTFDAPYYEGVERYFTLSNIFVIGKYHPAIDSEVMSEVYVEDFDASLDDYSDWGFIDLFYEPGELSFRLGYENYDYCSERMSYSLIFIGCGLASDSYSDLPILKTLCMNNAFSDPEGYELQHSISGNDVSGNDVSGDDSDTSGNNPSGNNPSGGNDNNHTSRLFDFNVSSLFYYTEAITDSLMVIVYIAGGFALGFGIINMLKNAFKLR